MAGTSFPKLMVEISSPENINTRLTCDAKECFTVASLDHPRSKRSSSRVIRKPPKRCRA